MAKMDFTLSAAPTLGGLDVSIGATRLKERSELAVVSMAVPLGQDASVAKAVKSAFKLDIPKPTQASGDGARWIIQSAADQMLMLFEHDTPDANAVVNKALKGACYTTDQTDVWVVLEISGAGALAALERLCPIDLHDSAFPVGASARTVMEHMGALILRTGEDSYILMSASSSAGSFAHAVELSMTYTS